MKQAISRHLIGYLASTQALGVVFFHGAWILLAAATWAHAGGGEGGAADLASATVRAYARLGGIEDGHGDESGLFRVGGLIALAIHLLGELSRGLTGARLQVRGRVLVLVSAAIAAGGSLVALWPTMASGSTAADVAWLVAVFTTLTATATAWALLARRLAAHVLKLLEPTTPPARAAAAR
jgi:hypothetical protein